MAQDKKSNRIKLIFWSCILLVLLVINYYGPGNMQQKFNEFLDGLLGKNTSSSQVEAAPNDNAAQETADAALAGSDAATDSNDANAAAAAQEQAADEPSAAQESAPQDAQEAEEAQDDPKQQDAEVTQEPKAEEQTAK